MFSNGACKILVKRDINSPGSTSQKERRKERPLKAARNRWQARLNAETKEQRQAKLEADRDDDNRYSSEDNFFMLKEDKGDSKKLQRNEPGLSQENTINIGLLLN